MEIRPGIEIAHDAIAELCAQHQVVELSVFGSAARSDFGPGSDIDLLVRFAPDASVGFLALGALKRALEELLGREVDVVPVGGLKPSIRDDILRQARVLHAA